MGGGETGDGSSGRSRALLAVEHAADDAPPVPPSLLLGKKQQSPSTAGARKPDFAPPPPPSALLSKLQTFLPQMQAANRDLEEAMRGRPPEEFDIENVGSDDDERRVEMDVGLGVVDLKTEDALAEAQQLAGDASCTRNDDADDAPGAGAAAPGGNEGRRTLGSGYRAWTTRETAREPASRNSRDPADASTESRRPCRGVAS